MWMLEKNRDVAEGELGAQPKEQVILLKNMSYTYVLRPGSWTITRSLPLFRFSPSGQAGSWGGV